MRYLVFVLILLCSCSNEQTFEYLPVNSGIMRSYKDLAEENIILIDRFAKGHPSLDEQDTKNLKTLLSLSDTILNHIDSLESINTLLEEYISVVEKVEVSRYLMGDSILSPIHIKNENLKSDLITVNLILLYETLKRDEDMYFHYSKYELIAHETPDGDSISFLINAFNEYKTYFVPINSKDTIYSNNDLKLNIPKSLHADSLVGSVFLIAGPRHMEDGKIKYFEHKISYNPVKKKLKYRD